MVQLSIPACVSCARFDVPVAATEHHAFKLDDNPTMRISLCGACYRHTIGLLLALVSGSPSEPAEEPDEPSGLPAVLRRELAASLPIESADGMLDAQPTLPIEEPAAAPADGGRAKRIASKPAKKQTPAVGVKKTGVLQVVCPMEHRNGTKPYWVDVRSRHGHAQNHGVDAPDINWQNPDGVDLSFVCMEHKVCATVGGYGFPSPTSLQVHINRSTGWPKAEPAEPAGVPAVPVQEAAEPASAPVSAVADAA